MLGLRAATGLAGVEEVSVRALAKVERVLPPRLRRRVAALAEYALRVPDDTPAPQVDAEVLTTLAAACRDTERLRFDYRTHSGGEARRDVEPYRLIAWGRRWYLLAWDVERGDWRTFRADRITPRVPTGPRFAARPLPADDITAYLSGRVSAAAWRYRAEALVHAPAAEVASRIPAAAGHVEARDAGTCVLHTGSDSLDGLAVHLGLLGLDFTVTEPPELVERIAELAGRYARAVGKGA